MSTEERHWKKSVREKPIYLSFEVFAALRLLAKSKGSVEPGLPRITIDEMADSLLAEVLVARYPKITEHLKQVDKAERELVKVLGKAT